MHLSIDIIAADITFRFVHDAVFRSILTQILTNTNKILINYVQFSSLRSMQHIKLFTAFILSWKFSDWPTIAHSNKIPEELFSIHILHSSPSSASESDVTHLHDLCSLFRLLNKIKFSLNLRNVFAILSISYAWILNFLFSKAISWRKI